VIVVGAAEQPHVSVRDRPWQPGEERKAIMRFNDAKPIPETEVEQPVRSYDPAKLGEELLRIDHMLVNVVADHDVHRGIGERHALRVSTDE
jgi:hypothetical protein